VYEVRFRSRVSRYYKAVNFGVNSVDTEVTEVEAFESAALRAGEMRHTDIRVGSATVNVTAVPVKKVTLDYSGLWNRVRQASETRPEMVNRSLDHVLSATVDPTAVLSLIARVQQRDLSDSRGFTQDFQGWTGIVRVRPRPDLEQSVEATRTREDNAGRESMTDGLTFRVYGRLYRVVDVTLDVGVQRQDYLTEDREADRRFVTGVVTAQVTAKLRALLNVAVQRSRYSGTTDVLVTDFQGVIPTRDDRVSLDLYYRSSSQLMVGGRFGYAASDAVSGFVQRYHVDWYPFPGGSVRLGALYDEDVDSIADRRARRFSFTPTWTVNRRVVLNLNYTTLDVTGDPSPATRSLFATLTLIL
ncbi:MAG TPA: hypothetical protein VFM29_07425, partial [Vicinamibacteria bacterium]|nr:hypothetical protein [Vicinamibacteria bacterium]